MRRMILLTLLIFLSYPSTPSQSVAINSNGGDVSIRKLLLTSGLQSLNNEAAKLNEPLALSLAKAEIADAAWTFDREWSKEQTRFRVLVFNCRFARNLTPLIIRAYCYCFSHDFSLCRVIG